MAAAALLLGACSDDDSSEPDVPEAKQEALEAFTADLEAEGGLDEADAECVAAVVVVEADVTDEASLDELPDVDDATAEAIVDGIDDCVGLTEFFVAAVGATADVTQSDLECATDAADEGFIRSGMIADFTGADEMPDEMTDGLTELSEECPGFIEALAAEAEVRFEEVGPAIED